jgi:dynein light chain LC8-type
MIEDVPDEEDVKPKIRHALEIVESHMPQAKEKAGIEISIAAVDGNKQLMDIASHIKTAYDKQYPGSGKATEGVYHAMCGTHFASAKPFQYHRWSVHRSI